MAGPELARTEQLLGALRAQGRGFQDNAGVISYMITPSSPQAAVVYGNVIAQSMAFDLESKQRVGDYLSSHQDAAYRLEHTDDRWRVVDSFVFDQQERPLDLRMVEQVQDAFRQYWSRLADAPIFTWTSGCSATLPMVKRWLPTRGRSASWPSDTERHATPGSRWGWFWRHVTTRHWCRRT
jgi:hypothetical protein